MAINSLELNKKLVPELEKAIVQKATTGFLTDNVLRAKFVGAKTVLIPEAGFSGLGDYDRDSGFIRGSVSVTNTPYVLSQDRARTFSLDREDNDETGVAELAGQVMGEFVRTKVVPEVDAYCLSKLAGHAATKSQTVTVTSGKVYEALMDAVNEVQDAVGFDEELVAFVSAAFWADLMTTTEFSRMLAVSDFKKGELHTEVKSVNGIPLLPVPTSRMKSAYTFYDGIDHSGEDSGVDQSDGGFVPAAAAKDVGFIVLPKRAASLVKKTEKVRIFEPDVNQDMDAYKFDYRLYYDLFIKNNMSTAIYANIAT